MLLLEKYKDKKIIVAHVNYHKRKDADFDQKVVTDFCHKYNLPLKVLNVDHIPPGNFQHQARIIRYDFFAKIYQKYQCTKTLMAHHKDDFLETALMQQQSKRLPSQFGIAKRSVVNQMNIYRPFIDLYYKKEIIHQLRKKNILFAIDSTNELPIYERNKVRLELKDKTWQEKEQLFRWFKMSNKILLKKHRRIKKSYNKWASTEFSTKNFKALERDKIYIVFKYLHSNFCDIKISSAKLQSLVDFIEGEKGNVTFKLNDYWGVKKINGKLVKSKISKKSK